MEYLNNSTGNSIVESNEKCFSVFEILGTGKDEIYLWVLKDNKSGGAGSMPVVLKATKENGILHISSYKIPGDGEQNKEDIEKMFPKEIQKKIHLGVKDYNARVARLQKQLDKMKKNN